MTLRVQTDRALRLNNRLRQSGYETECEFKREETLADAVNIDLRTDEDTLPLR